jgi:hypothetical protein
MPVVSAVTLPYAQLPVHIYVGAAAGRLLPTGFNILEQSERWEP